MVLTDVSETSAGFLFGGNSFKSSCCWLPGYYNKEPPRCYERTMPVMGRFWILTIHWHRRMQIHPKYTYFGKPSRLTKGTSPAFEIRIYMYTYGCIILTNIFFWSTRNLQMFEPLHFYEEDIYISIFIAISGSLFGNVTPKRPRCGYQNWHSPWGFGSKRVTVGDAPKASESFPRLGSQVGSQWIIVGSTVKSWLEPET